MTTNTEHHNLFEQFKAAQEKHVAAVKDLHDYIITPNYDFETSKKLSKRMDDALSEVSRLKHELQKANITT